MARSGSGRAWRACLHRGGMPLATGAAFAAGHGRAAPSSRDYTRRFGISPRNDRPGHGRPTRLPGVTPSWRRTIAANALAEE